MARRNRVGETTIANNGMQMTVIAYRTHQDIDVQFEDGAIKKHVTYYNFIKGYIRHPQSTIARKTQRIGETAISKAGHRMTIIAYRTGHDIDVQFDDGTVSYHKDYRNFKKGAILHPKDNPQTKHNNENVTARNGMKMAIIAYHGTKNVDVQFEDGTIRKNISYANFKRGAVENPNYTSAKNRNINRTIKLRNGFMAKIIDYKNCNDITIQLEDGTVIEHLNVNTIFVQKSIKHPTINTMIQDKTCETNIATCGLKMTIINYKGACDIDVEFEDGYISKNKAYKEFKNGHISHPFPFVINDIMVNKKAYIYDGIGNFYCTCSKCGVSDIMTISEIKEHKCNTRGNNNV